MALGFGGSSSSGKSTSSGYGYGLDINQSYLDPYQQANQQQLVNSYFGAQPGAPTYQPMTNQLLGMNLNYAGQQPTYGMTQLNQFAQQGNPYLQASIDQYGQNLSQQFGRTLQQIGGGAQLAGQRGSSRQGIAEGMAFQDMLDTYSQGVTGMQSAAYGQQQQAAQQYALFEAQQRALGQQATMQGLQGIGQATANYFSPFTIGAGIIGAPSVLSSGLGLDYQEQQSKSKSSSGGFSIGF